MLQNKPLATIQNVVATAALKHGVDLHAVVKAFPEVEYRPEQFPGAIFRLKRLKTTILIFGSGKMVCAGARSGRGARSALKWVVRKLKHSGIIIVDKPKIEIVNIVATSRLGGEVDLIGFYEAESALGGRIMYEPDQFPGLIYRMNDPRAVFLIFSSGKVVCTGTRNEEETCQAVKKLYRRVEDDGMIMRIMVKNR